MRLLDLFGRRARTVLSGEDDEEKDDADSLRAYSGMRVGVTTFDDRLLFVAKLMKLRGNTAELQQYSETGEFEEGESFSVRIRGYSDHRKKAVYMEGIITSVEKHIWRVEELAVKDIINDRAFFRLNVNLDAVTVTFIGADAGEKPCRLLNISIGGAFIFSEYRYYKGDKFLLRVQLLEDRPESALFCEVLRIIEKKGEGYEYGCQFLELTEEDQQKIAQNIFTIQSRNRNVQ